jgi:hypothetical protein
MKSDLDWMAASVRTRVVSWKEAADSHESVAQRGLGDTHQLETALGRHLALFHQSPV